MAFSALIDRTTNRIASSYLPPQQLDGFFIDTAPPIQTLLAGPTDTIGFDITPPSPLVINSHYLITWTTLFTGTPPLTGSIKWGLSQNAVPFALPLNNQESATQMDVAFNITASTAGTSLVSCSFAYLVEPAPNPPNITLFYEGTSLSANVSVQLRDASIIRLD